MEGASSATQLCSSNEGLPLFTPGVGGSGGRATLSACRLKRYFSRMVMKPSSSGSNTRILDHDISLFSVWTWTLGYPHRTQLLISNRGDNVLKSLHKTPSFHGMWHAKRRAMLRQESPCSGRWYSHTHEHGHQNKCAHEHIHLCTFTDTTTRGKKTPFRLDTKIASPLSADGAHYTCV